MKNMEVKIIPALISAVLLFIFISPVFMGIFNIGNAVGILVSGSLTGIFVFWKPFVSLIKQLWNNQAGKIFLCVFTAIISIC
ncbi:MAG: hypothetical protein K2G14_02255, partial [Ruminococcus sp.]|nr:hypothetical protein [Ruminococcus sp.]